LDKFVKDTANFVSGLMCKGKFGSLESFGYNVGLCGLTMCQMGLAEKLKNVRWRKLKIQKGRQSVSADSMSYQYLNSFLSFHNGLLSIFAVSPVFLRLLKR